MTDREQQFEIQRIENGSRSNCNDFVTREEPLEIRIVFGPVGQRKTRVLSVTMRTPGNDYELAAGFLVSEGIISGRSQIGEQRFVGSIPEGQSCSNEIEIELDPQVEFEFNKLQRHSYTTSSCGICGKSSIAAIRADNVLPIRSESQIHSAIVHQLPELLKQQQAGFHRTGGLHAAGLARTTGEIVLIREDVGRHNAVDKLIGCQLLAGSFPIHDAVLVLSGRASFELMQKSLLAAIPIVVAVGAPSSLAVELAREFNLTLIGFTSPRKFNVYSGQERVTIG